MMENQLEMKLENDMETPVICGILGVRSPKFYNLRASSGSDRSPDSAGRVCTITS